MRIPLDYYRILGVFPQATDEQIRQAYRDRSIQLPRREYNQNAIQGRRQLLEQAYGILSNPAQKASYEAQFWQNHFSNQEEREFGSSSPGTGPIGESSVPESSEIDIKPEQLPGSLLILHELGEYELVIKFGESYLQSLPSFSLTLDIDDTSTKNRSDTILSIALACLEISREQWHQKAYEQAALAGTQGLTLLEKNNLFPSVQAEIRTELHKLRPYRILELLAYPLTEPTSRKTGIELLKSMLKERQGIDGKRDDHSGLDIDDFLRFIQQIRTYLTAVEQQEIFMEEAQRPSSVAAYLGVYALIARGFAEKDPSLILEAQTVLEGLEPRQDVSIEQAIVALLLGQTQAATQALEKCQDQQALSFIRERSQGDPDLLPGLCLYSEHWLQTEVFSHFRDLMPQTASLKEYFADQQVQTYLDELLSPSPQKPQPVITAEKRQSPSSRLGNRRYPTYQTNSMGFDQGNTALAPLPLPARSSAPVDIRDARRRKRSNYVPKPKPEQSVQRAPEKSSQPKLNIQTPVPQTDIVTTPKPHHVSRRKPRRAAIVKPKTGLTMMAIIGGVGLVGLCLTWIYQASSPLSALEKGQYSVSVHKPLIDIPSADAQMVSATGMLTMEGAQQVIEMWLSSKSQAFGREHDIESLNKILANPLLSQWRDRAQKLQKNQNYWNYQHQIKVNSFKPSQNNQNKAVIDANVIEAAQYYQQGKVSRSYNDDLRVRYDLVRQGDRWLIQRINVIN
ncbi:MAG: IMS domain-containing protein [Crocosphaera sp.]